MLTVYQSTELVIGTWIFIFCYIGYLYYTDYNSKYFLNNIFVSTILFIILMSSRYLLINYYILQSQNFSSNIIIND